ncbi:hypothetical protein Taro_014695, partial [Colocasia esculenta]|nr:hypothetical protein [Colocasia esculenta]
VEVVVLPMFASNEVVDNATCKNNQHLYAKQITIALPQSLKSILKHTETTFHTVAKLGMTMHCAVRTPSGKEARAEKLRRNPRLPPSSTPSHADLCGNPETLDVHQMFRGFSRSPLLPHRPLQLRHIHASQPLRHRRPWTRPEPLARSEVVDRLCSILTLERYGAISKLPFSFDDDLLGSVLRRLRLDPGPCLELFRIALRQRFFLPGAGSYCRIVHILSRGRMYDEARALLKELVRKFGSGSSSISYVFDELIVVYREFSFSSTVFDMLLKAYAENGQVKEALFVLDNMGRYGCKPSLRSCNKLLSCLVKKDESYTAIHVYHQLMKADILPDVYTVSVMVNAYCKCGDVQKAMGFLEEMEIKGFDVNLVVYNSLINGYCDFGQAEAASEVVKLMSRKGIMPNVLTFTMLIKGYCKDGKIEEAERVLWSMKAMPCLAPDEIAYGVLVNAYGQIGRMDDATRVKDEMLSAGLTTNLYIYNSLINGYCKLGRMIDAEKLLGEMEIGQPNPDSYTYNTLIDGYCKKGLMKEAFGLCNVMLGKGIAPTVLTYNTFLKGFCRLGAVDDALRLWYLMQKRGIYPDVISCGILLDGFFKFGYSSQALKLWNDILARGLAKSQFLFNTAIDGLFKMGNLPEAERIFSKMKDGGCSPDSMTYRAMSDGYCRIGDIKRAFEIRGEMERKGISPSVEMFNSLMGGLFRSGKYDKVDELLIDMHVNGLTPNVITYGVLIAGWCKEGMVDKAFDAYFEMLGNGLAPNIFICSCLISNLYRQRKIEEANILLHRMVDNIDFLGECFLHEKSMSHGILHLDVEEIAKFFVLHVGHHAPANNVVLNVVIGGLCRSGRLEDARKLFSNLLHRGFIPDNFTYCTLIDGYSAAGKINKAFELRDDMVRKGLLPNVVTYNTLIKGLCQLGHLDRAVRLFQKLCSKGVHPNVVTYNTLMDGYSKDGNLTEAYKLKQEMEESGILSSVVTYSVLINGLCKQGDMYEAMKLLNEMIERGVSPNHMTYASLVKGYIRQGNVECISKLYQEMHIRALLPAFGFCRKMSVAETTAVKKCMANIPYLFEAVLKWSKHYAEKSETKNLPSEETYHALVEFRTGWTLLRSIVAARRYASLAVSLATSGMSVNNLGRCTLAMRTRTMKRTPIRADVETATNTANLAAFAFPAPSSLDTRTLKTYE